MSQWFSSGQILFFGTCLRKFLGYAPASLSEGTSYSVTLNFEKRFNNHRSIIFVVNFHCFKKNKSTSLCSYLLGFLYNSFKKYVSNVIMCKLNAYISKSVSYFHNQNVSEMTVKYHTKYVTLVSFCVF